MLDPIDWRAPISRYFFWWETVVTEHRGLRDRNRALLEGDPLFRANAVRLARDILDPIRARCGLVHVNSWFRCPELNDAVGGNPHSDHLQANAVDFRVPLHTIAETWARTQQVIHDVPFGQLILEPIGAGPDAWIHVSYETIAHAREIIS